MKTIAFHSSKGGVGKTSAAANIAFLAARKSHLRVLLIDLDPQGSASFLFRMKPAKDFSGKDLLKGGSLPEAGVRGSDYEGLDLIPAALSFRKFEALLSGKSKGKARGALKKALASFEGSCDLAILDCPSGMGLLPEAVYEASDMVLCPALAAPLSLMSMKRFDEFISKRKLDAAKFTAFISMFEPRKSTQAQAAKELEASGHALLKTRIPRSADVERMGVLREPVCASKPDSKAAQAFVSLWEELRALLFA